MPISLTLHTLHSSPLHWGEASPSPPLFAYCYRALVNGGLDLSVICMCVCGYAKLGIFPVTSVSRMSTAASTHTMDFFYFLLKSYYSHFSQYSRFPHIQAICQVTMTGAGMCKQDICIQEIALLQCAFPQAVSVRKPKYSYSFAKGGNWKIACADMNTQTHLHAGT